MDHVCTALPGRERQEWPVTAPHVASFEAQFGGGGHVPLPSGEEIPNSLLWPSLEPPQLGGWG